MKTIKNIIKHPICSLVIALSSILTIILMFLSFSYKNLSTNHIIISIIAGLVTGLIYTFFIVWFSNKLTFFKDIKKFFKKLAKIHLPLFGACIGFILLLIGIDYVFIVTIIVCFIILPLILYIIFVLRNRETEIFSPLKSDAYIDNQMLSTNTKKAFTIFLIFLIFLFAIVLFRTAWISDDSYISFKSVDNFVNGYGLNWNVGERVQTFTNPLWVLIVSGFYSFSNEPFYTSIILSIIVSVLAISLFVFNIPQTRISGIVALSLLLFSKAFIDYSTSGLENPLTHLLLVLFFIVFFKYEINGKTLFILSLIAGLGTLNRMDILLIYAPPLIYALFFKYKRIPKGILLLFLGFLPFVLWEMFSLVYYGFLFPNTMYAKMNTGIEFYKILGQGFLYILDLMTRDFLTLISLSIGISIMFLFKKERRLIAPTIGIILYILYILRIGGDFMAGRFFAAPLLVSIILISRVNFHSFKVALSFVVIIFIVGITNPMNNLASDKKYSDRVKSPGSGIADERGFYFTRTGFLIEIPWIDKPNHHYKQDGLRLKRQGKKVHVSDSIGFLGYYAGPDVHIIDKFALCDPLLARIPFQRDWEVKAWRIGHFYRSLPLGYEESIRTGENKLTNPYLKKYYDKLSTIIRGDIFSLKRFATIFKMNTGQYNYLMEEYENYIEIEGEDMPSDYDKKYNVSQKLLNPKDNQSSGNKARYGNPKFIKNKAFLVYGPFIHPKKGQYRGVFTLKIPKEAKNKKIAQLQISSRNKVLHKMELKGQDFDKINEYQNFTIDFELERFRWWSIELRIHYYDNAELYVDKCHLIHLSGLKKEVVY